MRLNMRKTRLALGLTHAEVAAKADIARTTYTNIELGGRDPSLAVALRIKKALGVSGDDIFLVCNVPHCDGHVTNSNASTA